MIAFILLLFFKLGKDKKVLDRVARQMISTNSPLQTSDKRQREELEKVEKKKKSR